MVKIKIENGIFIPRTEEKQLKDIFVPKIIMQPNSETYDHIYTDDDGLFIYHHKEDE